MRNTGTGAHQLNLTGKQPASISHAILVFERAIEDVTENLHVAVRVGGKTTAGRHTVFIDHAQAAKAHVFVIVIIRETEAVA